MKDFIFITGAKLPNGAILLKYKQLDNEGNHIVLALYNREFVTWAANRSGETFWGYYTMNLEKALVDFQQR